MSTHPTLTAEPWGGFRDAQVGDVFTMQGEISLGGGLTAQVEHSQTWIVTGSDSGSVQCQPVKIDTVTLRNGWVVKYAPRPMTPDEDY